MATDELQPKRRRCRKCGLPGHNSAACSSTGPRERVIGERIARALTIARHYTALRAGGTK